MSFKERNPKEWREAVLRLSGGKDFQHLQQQAQRLQKCLAHEKKTTRSVCWNGVRERSGDDENREREYMPCRQTQRQSI